MRLVDMFTGTLGRALHIVVGTVLAFQGLAMTGPAGVLALAAGIELLTAGALGMTTLALFSHEPMRGRHA